MTDSTYRICWTIEDWAEALREARDAQYVGYDFESKPNPRFIDFAPAKVDGQANKSMPSALRPEFGAKIAGIGVAWWCETKQTIKSAYVGIRHDRKYAGGEQPDALKAIEAFSDFFRYRNEHHNSSTPKLDVVHNLSMELSFQLAEGIPWPSKGRLHDIQIAARVLNKGVGWKELIGLKPLQQEVLGRDLTSKNDLDRWLKTHRFKPGADIWRAPVALAGYYGQDDARDTLLIFMKWKNLIVQESTDWWWHRGPDRSQRRDLYELEIEAGIQSTISAMQGTRFNRTLAKRQTTAANMLQRVATRWLRHYLEMPTLNPGSQTQLRGLLFKGATFGFKPSLQHTTDAFKKMSDRDQVRVMAGQSDTNIIDYMSLDVEALDYYAQKYPEHSDLMFMLQVYRKCNTALAWFDERVLQFAVFSCPDPWFNEEPTDWIDLWFHRLRTVGTVSGRMSSADFNAQQVPKRFKMLMDAGRLFTILEAFLPENQLRQLTEALLTGECASGDEEKVLRLEAGDPVIDFSVRSMFITRPDYNMRLLDLSQVELRGFAHYTGNKLLCGGYGQPMTNDEVTGELGFIREFMDTGEMPDLWKFQADWVRHMRMESCSFDAHQFVADEIGIPRKGAKGINFGIIYGMGKKKLARSLGWSIEDGRRYLREYNGRFPEIETVQKQIKIALRTRGYVFDPFGRRYYLPMNRAYVGLNRLIQGWAASAFKVGFVRTCEMFASPMFGSYDVHPIIGRRLSINARVNTCIHDELMNEIRAQYDTPLTDWAIRSCMTAFYGLKVPLASSSERSIYSPSHEASWDDAQDVQAQDIRSAA